MLIIKVKGATLELDFQSCLVALADDFLLGWSSLYLNIFHCPLCIQLKDYKTSSIFIGESFVIISSIQQVNVV